MLKPVKTTYIDNNVCMWISFAKPSKLRQYIVDNMSVALTRQARIPIINSSDWYIQSVCKVVSTVLVFGMPYGPIIMKDTRMTYDEFEKKARELVSVSTESTNKRRRSYYRNDDDGEVSPYIYVQYETGGVSGGSCWDSSNPRPYSNSNADTESEFVDFYAVLEGIAPKMSFLEVKKLESKIEIQEWTMSEYYGNCTEYKMKSIPLKTIYDYLVEKGYC